MNEKDIPVARSMRLIKSIKKGLWQESWSEYAPEWISRRCIDTSELKWYCLGKPIKLYYKGR